MGSNHDFARLVYFLTIVAPRPHLFYSYLDLETDCDNVAALPSPRFLYLSIITLCNEIVWLLVHPTDSAGLRRDWFRLSATMSRHPSRQWGQDGGITMEVQIHMTAIRELRGKELPIVTWWSGLWEEFLNKWKKSPRIWR